MSKTFDQGKEEAAKLCLHFTTNRQAFLRPRRQGGPHLPDAHRSAFRGVGVGRAECGDGRAQYREVIPQDSLDVEGQQKAPDYAFRVGTLPKFYAEAKKCGVNINRTRPGLSASPLRLEAQSCLSILTNFEQLAVYDCTARPQPKRQGQSCPILYFGYQEYPDHWRELWDLFSRECRLVRGVSTSTQRRNGSAAHRKLTWSF